MAIYGCFQTALLLVVVVLLLSLSLAVAGPNISAIPSEIEPGSTEELSINCTFSWDENPTVATVISLFLSRSNDSQHFTDLATINQYSDLSVLTSENMTATGTVRDTDGAFVHLHWDFPSELQGGYYQCTVQGIDNSGHVIVEHDVFHVNVNLPEDWAGKIALLNSQLRSLEETVAKLELHTKDLENRLETNLTNFVSEQEQRRLSETFLDPITYNGHTYYIYRKLTTGIDMATAICESFGGYLVEIQDFPEFTAVQQYVNGYPSVYGIYIAGADEHDDGQWVLPSTRLPLPYTRWGPGEPNGDVDQGCLIMYRPDNFLMADTDCYPVVSKYSFVCEFQQ